MVWVRCIRADSDRSVGVIYVTAAIEARIERADEVAARIIDRSCQPALSVIAAACRP